MFCAASPSWGLPYIALPARGRLCGRRLSQGCFRKIRPPARFWFGRECVRAVVVVQRALRTLSSPFPRFVRLLAFLYLVAGFWGGGDCVRCLADRLRRAIWKTRAGRVAWAGGAWRGRVSVRDRACLPACFVHALDWMGGGLGRVWCLNGDGLLLPSIFLPPVCFLRIPLKKPPVWLYWLAVVVFSPAGSLFS